MFLVAEIMAKAKEVFFLDPSWNQEEKRHQHYSRCYGYSRTHADNGAKIRESKGERHHSNTRCQCELANRDLCEPSAVKEAIQATA